MAAKTKSQSKSWAVHHLEISQQQTLLESLTFWFLCFLFKNHWFCFCFFVSFLSIHDFCLKPTIWCLTPRLLKGPKSTCTKGLAEISLFARSEKSSCPGLPGQTELNWKTLAEDWDAQTQEKNWTKTHIILIKIHDNMEVAKRYKKMRYNI